MRQQQQQQAAENSFYMQLFCNFRSCQKIFFYFVFPFFSSERVRKRENIKRYDIIAAATTPMYEYFFFFEVMSCILGD
jgi:hypothetical protein